MRAPLLCCLLAAVLAIPLPTPAAEGAGWISGVRFTIAVGSPIRGSPVVDDGVVYFGSTDGRLHAADARSGEVRWRFATGGAVDSTPAIDSGRIYFTSRDGFLYSVST